MNKNIIVINGDDSAQSRKKLDDYKSEKENTENISIDANSATITDLVTAVETMSILNREKVIIVENLLSGRKNAEKLQMIKYIAAQNSQNRFIIWDGKSVDKKTILANFKDANIISCNYPAVLFRFLDSIGLIPKEEILGLFHSVLKEKDAELIFVMMIRQIRMLIMAKDFKEKGIPGLPPWQSIKFSRQARLFDMKKLISIYRKLISIDLKIKSGKTPYKMAQLLDIYLLNI